MGTSGSRRLAPSVPPLSPPGGHVPTGRHAREISIAVRLSIGHRQDVEHRNRWRDCPCGGGRRQARGDPLSRRRPISPAGSGMVGLVRRGAGVSPGIGSARSVGPASCPCAARGPHWVGRSRTRTRRIRTCHRRSAEGRSVADDFLASEAGARQRSLGVWADAGYKPIGTHQADRLKDRIGTFVIVEGRVRNVGERAQWTYLNFGGRWAEDFTVIIPKRIWKRMTDRGGDAAAFRGRPVRVRGILEAWQGASVTVEIPEMIEFLPR